MIHGQAIKSVHGSETSVRNAIINMYSKCDAIYESDRSFETMYRRDEVLWSTIIGAYEQNGLALEALRRCREMAVAGFGPTQFSFASCISACSSLAALDVGRQFHSLIIKAGFGGDVYVGSSVVDMYTKCGNIEDSNCAFHDLNHPNIVAYNTMRSGLAQHGRANKAIQIFKEFGNTETTPNKTTFICLLTACSHVGLLEESMFFFDMMYYNYKIEPEFEHYYCSVDVLGRAGKLDDAYKIISGCLYNVGVSVWRTFLSACWKYKNVSRGEESAKRVMQLEPLPIFRIAAVAAIQIWPPLKSITPVQSAEAKRQTTKLPPVPLLGSVLPFLGILAAVTLAAQFSVADSTPDTPLPKATHSIRTGTATQINSFMPACSIRIALESKRVLIFQVAADMAVERAPQQQLQPPIPHAVPLHLEH
ncbi:putative pentatricopeptide repeat-containing protein At3g23330 [Aristolochia californica]|uniref:putative pentatricopeptide repeat-containing protein At3g23330 n=1 Tax=Aristolochia californica TaxID=171875 RepID=UPI0035DC07C5